MFPYYRGGEREATKKLHLDWEGQIVDFVRLSVDH